MKRVTEQIIAESTIGKSEEIPIEMLYSYLIGNIASVIDRELDTLPVKITKRIDDNTGATIHRMKINLISDEELYRLRNIEDELFQIKREYKVKPPIDALNELKKTIEEAKKLK